MTEQNFTETTGTPEKTPEEIAAAQAFDAHVTSFLDTLNTESDAWRTYVLLSRKFGFIGTAFSQSDVSLFLWEQGIGEQSLNEKLTHMILDDDKARKTAEEQMADFGNEVLNSEISTYVSAVTDDRIAMVVRTDAGDIEVHGEEDIVDAESLATASVGGTVREMVAAAEADEEELELSNSDGVPLDATITAVFAKLRIGAENKLLPLA